MSNRDRNQPHPWVRGARRASPVESARSRGLGRMKTCTRPRSGRSSAKTRSRFRLRQAIQYRLVRSTMRSWRRLAASRTRVRKADTIAFEVPLVHSLLGSMCLTSRFPDRFLQDEEELEAPQEEVETTGPVLPHRGRRPVVVANQDDRVDEFEALRQDAQKAIAHWSIGAAAIFVCDNPREDASRTQHAVGFRCDPSEFLVKPRVAARNAAEAPGIPAVLDVVRVGRINHGECGSLILQGP